MYRAGRKVMNISKDTNGKFILKWDGGDHGLDHEIEDPEDPRYAMHCVERHGKFHYGVELVGRRRARDGSPTPQLVLVPKFYMFGDIVPYPKDYEGDKSESMVFKGYEAVVYKNERRNWIVKWRKSHITITI